MRWPLRFQIFVGFTALLLGAVATVSVLDAYFAARAYRERVEQQLRDVASTLASASFPLTEAVLRQANHLSGAHFVLATRSGAILASSHDELKSVPLDVPPVNCEQLTLGEPIQVNGSTFLHANIHATPAYGRGSAQHLHIFYPERSWKSAWWQNVYPRLTIGGIALLLSAIFSALLASRVSHPIARLRGQVSRIARGCYEQLPEPRRNDEVSDLVRDVNRMARMLAEHEEQLRRDERLKALGQLRGGLAHQLRNAVTGCRMALDLHRMRAGEETADSESLTVAHRQLALIEKHLEQFLRFNENAVDASPEPVDISALTRQVIPLVEPAASHAGVQIRLVSSEPAWALAEPAALEQVAINLLLNAIEAVSASESSQQKVVQLQTAKAGDSVRLVVSDNGPGPSDAVRDRLFEPLITEKPGGTGLGLAASQQAIMRLGGRLHWYREDGWTRFVVELRTSDAAETSLPQEHQQPNLLPNKISDGTTRA